MKNKNELEEAINNSRLFFIDRINDEDYYVAEKRKLINNLAELVQLTRRDFAEIGFEIMNTAQDCINNYEFEKGNFLNYFNFSLKNAVNNAKIKNDKYYSNIIEKTAASDDSDGSELLDIIADTDESPENKSVSTDTVAHVFRNINAHFKLKQDRTKQLLSKLLTIRLAEFLVAYCDNWLALSFVDQDIIRQYISSNHLPSVKDIALSLSTSEQQASRTIGGFMESLKENEEIIELLKITRNNETRT